MTRKPGSTKAARYRALYAIAAAGLVWLDYRFVLPHSAVACYVLFFVVALAAFTAVAHQS